MAGMREAIGAGSFESFREKTRADWARGDIDQR
jgi:queuine tRNA-ribosyltransferase